ncbi:patched family domain-containing protein [Ditylenchus destructor]|nr:patched family domain-containing protein [Ditylenchus destructor]
MTTKCVDRRTLYVCFYVFICSASFLATGNTAKWTTQAEGERGRNRVVEPVKLNRGIKWDTVRILHSSDGPCGVSSGIAPYWPLDWPTSLEDFHIELGTAHKNGRSTQEFKAFGDFYNVSVSEMELLLVFVESKDSASPKMSMSAELLNEVVRLDEFLKTLSVPIPGENRLRFNNMQTSRGDINFLFHAFKFGFDFQDDNVRSNQSLDESIVLRYPVSKIYGHNVTLESHFFEVDVYDDDEAKHRATNVKSVGAIALWYMIHVKSSKMKSYLQDIELTLFETSKRDNFSSLFSFHIYADGVANYEMMRGSERTIKLLAVGIFLMILFMMFALREHNWKAQIMLIFSAILSPFLAIGTSFAILGWLGIPINSIMCIMPFLILGIGVDDAFLLLHCWRKWGLVEKNSELRMASVISEIGPSISITSITNMLAFGVGVFSPSSQLSHFCLSTTIAVMLDFLFEFVTFAPCMVASERFTSFLPVPNRPSKKKSPFCSKYAAFISSKWGRLLCVILLPTMYIFAYFGIAQMEVTFDPQKTFPADSPLKVYAHNYQNICYCKSKFNNLLFSKFFQYAPLSFIVSNPPNISDFSEMKTFFSLIDELESLPDTYGANRTELWLRPYLKFDYEKYLENISRNTNSSVVVYDTPYVPSYQRVPQFLDDFMIQDKNVVLFHKNENRVIIDQFVFVLICHGRRSWHKRAFFVDSVREKVDRYSQFNVTVFDYDSTIYDLIITVKPEMAKSVLTTWACMALVCFAIVPHLKYTGVATLSVLSIAFTLLGALGWWKLDLDPVTMINVIMAIGFSVDFSAHICYHYYKLRNDLSFSSQDHARLTEILNVVGRPMLEAASSTIICMFPLFFISIYVIGSFAKTVVCVGVLGTIHGLFVIPVLLSIEFGTTGKSRNRRGNSIKGTTEGSDRSLATPTTQISDLIPRL